MEIFARLETHLPQGCAFTHPRRPLVQATCQPHSPTVTSPGRGRRHLLESSWRFQYRSVYLLHHSLASRSSAGAEFGWSPSSPPSFPPPLSHTQGQRGPEWGLPKTVACPSGASTQSSGSPSDPHRPPPPSCLQGAALRVWQAVPAPLIRCDFPDGHSFINDALITL